MKYKQIIDLAKSGDGRVLMGNFSYLLLLQIVSYLFPLITIPYLAKVIGAYGMGKVAFSAAIMSWIQTIADWGFSFTATRDVAQNKTDKEKVSRIFSDVTWSRCFLTFICFVILVLLLVVIPKFSEDAVVILFTFLMVPGHILFPDWFFQAIEKMEYITILNIAIKFLSLIAIFIFIKNPEDYALQPLFISIGYIVCGFVSLYFITIKWGYKLYRPSFISIRITLNKSKDVFINNLAPNLYNSYSTMLLGLICGDVATGKLSAGGTFSGALQQFMQVIFRTFFPFLSRKIDKHYVFARMSITISAVLVILLIVFSSIVMDLFFTDEFRDCTIILQVLTLSTFFLSLSIIYGTNYLIIIGRERLLRNITIIASIVGFTIAYPLIVHLGALGAAITICVSRGLMGVLSMVAAKRITV